MKTSGSSVTRRSFAKGAVALFGAPLVIPSKVLGLDGAVAPSNKITFAGFGWGMQGPHNTFELMKVPGVQFIAYCDIDKKHLASAVDSINKKAGTNDAKGFHDYREVIARKDIDAVQLSLPDNWHALVAVAAAKAKKDIWGEKPLARTIREQQAIVKAVTENNVIWQTGSWQRSTPDFPKACEIVRNGMIGKVMKVDVGLPSGHNDFAGTKDKMAVTPPPAELDYDTWIGPAKMEPYIEGRVHKNWRWNYNIGGGQLLDWIGHHCDIAHWGLGFDETGPVEIEGHGEFPAKDAVWNTCKKYRIALKYANGVEMTIAGGHDDIKGGTKWYGEGESFVHVNRGYFMVDKAHTEWRTRTLKDDERKIKLDTGVNHWQNFVDCIRSRKPTVTPVTVAHRSATPGHLGLISMMVGRKLQWDPVKEEILNDPEATKLLGREYREGYKLEV